MNYINTQTLEYPVTLEQLKAANPLTIFPEGFADDFEDFAPVHPTEPPAHDAATHRSAEAAPELVDGQWLQRWEVVALTPQEITARAAEAVALLAALKAKATGDIDEAVATIYGRFTRFAIEYQEREAQAQAYKDAGYTGDVPPRVSEFATPAGMPAQAATDLILQQAVNLRAAQGALSALRMRKYEVLRAATDEQAQAVAAEILAGVAAVGANVS